MIHRLLRRIPWLCVLAGLPAIAVATGNPAVHASRSLQLQEIIVTAERFAEPVSRTPISMTVLSGQALKNKGIVSVADLTNAVPGVFVGNASFGTYISIRGVTTTDNTSKGEQGIGYYVDGIMLGRPLEEGLSLFDIRRISILRGPQGTLYGQSTTGGVINVTTNRPTDRFETSGDLTFGNYNALRADAMINVPVTKSFYLRAAVNSNRVNGYIRPIVDYRPADAQDNSTARQDQNDRSGRLSALFKLGRRTRLVVSATSSSVGGVGGSTVPIPTVLGHSGSGQLIGYADPIDSHIDEHFTMVNGELTTDFGPVALTWVGGHIRFSANDVTSSTFDPGLNSNQYQWLDYRLRPAVTDSQELRLSNSRQGPWRWVVGADWYREDINEDYHRFEAPVSTPTYAASLNAIDAVNDTVHVAKGVFGQSSYTFDKRVRLTLGLRYTEDSVVRHGSIAPGPFAANFGTQLCPPAPRDCIFGPNDNGSERDHKITYHAGVNYFFTRNQMLYGVVATGFKAGGFNDPNPFPPHAITIYRPESLTDFEMGYKGMLLDRRMEFDSDIYYYDYSAAQITANVAIANTVIVDTLTTPVRVYGWENQLTWRISDANMLSASLSLMHSKYVNFHAGPTFNVNWAGKSLDHTPAATASIDYTHNWSLPNQGTLSAHAGLFYSTSYVISAYFLAAQYRQPAYTRTDLRLTYTSPSGHYYVQGFVRNLENKVQLLEVGQTNMNDAHVSAPRYFGIRLGFNF